MKFTAIEPGWKGATAFIVAGGTSVLNQNLKLLVGQKVIAVNSSYEVVPWADVLFFGDARWFFVHQHRPALQAFNGRFISCAKAVRDSRVWKVRRVIPDATGKPGWTDARDAVVCNRTSLQGAMNAAGHLGVARIVLLGADMCRAADGRSHHHSAHPWPNKPGNKTWDIQMRQLAQTVAPLRERGIEVINTSPTSRLPWWPKRRLESVLFGPAADFVT
jgi:hypothetical protein